MQDGSQLGRLACKKTAMQPDSRERQTQREAERSQDNGAEDPDVEVHLQASNAFCTEVVSRWASRQARISTPVASPLTRVESETSTSALQESHKSLTDLTTAWQVKHNCMTDVTKTDKHVESDT